MGNFRIYYKKWLLFIATICIAAIIGIVVCSCGGQEKSAQTTTEKKAYKTEQKTLWSNNLKQDWNYYVCLPDGYDNDENKNKQYPIVYIMHGAYGTYENWGKQGEIFDNADKLIKDNKIEECVICCIDGFNSFYIDKNLQMESAVINELMPNIASKYRVNQTKEHTFIGGLSMGGYGAARFALKYPEKFKAAFLLSPALWEHPNSKDGKLVYEQWGIFKDAAGNFDAAAWDSYHPNQLIDAYAQNNSPVKFYIAHGEKDVTVDISNTDHFVEKLKNVTDVTYERETDLGHEWTLWKNKGADALVFCLKK